MHKEFHKDSMRRRNGPPGRRASLADEIAEDLRRSIEAGETEAFLPPERKFCDHYFVSRPTLRRALLQLRNEGLLIIRHGQRTHVVRPRRRRNPTKNGMVNFILPLYPVCPNTDNAMMMEEIETRLVHAGFQFRILRNPRFKSGDWNRLLPRIVQQNPADCWLLRSVSPKIVKWFVENDLPTVLLASPFPGIEVPSVDLDHRATLRHAVAQFARLGHRRVVLLAGDRKRSAEIETEAGFIEGCASIGSAADQFRIVRFDGSLPDLLRTLEVLFGKSQIPTGLITDASLENMTVLTWLLGHGFRVPSDVSLVCRDWDTVFDYLVPQPASYRYNRKRLVSQVCRWITQIASGESVPFKSVKLLTRFAPGDTLTPLDQDRSKSRGADTNRNSG